MCARMQGGGNLVNYLASVRRHVRDLMCWYACERGALNSFHFLAPFVCVQKLHSGLGVGREYVYGPY